MNLQPPGFWEEKAVAAIRVTERAIATRPIWSDRSRDHYVNTCQALIRILGREFCRQIGLQARGGPVLKRVAIVHDDPAFQEAASAALRKAGCDVVSYSGSMTALNEIETERKIDVLVTGVTFPPGEPNGQ